MAFKSMRIAQVKTNPTMARAAGKPMPVSTIVVEVGSLESLVGAECVAMESSRVALATEFDFRVAKVETAVGMQVVKDQLLLKFEDERLNQELENAIQGQAAARSMVRDMEPFLADMRKLEQKKLVSIPDMLRAVEDVGRARLDLIRVSKDVIRARHMIAKTEVRAPLDGVITALNVETGTTPQPFTDLLVISQLNPILLDCAFAETDIEIITHHDKIETSFDAYPGRLFPAEFYQLLPVANASNHTLSLLIRVSNTTQSFLPGMHAVARISKSLEGLRIPAISLIKPEADKANVFVVDSSATAHLREVQVGRYAQGYVQIKAGLEAGDRIVVAGQLYLQDGDRITENPRQEGDKLFPIRDH
jgi:RND family efflux transporter MFP subunit